MNTTSVILLAHCVVAGFFYLVIFDKLILAMVRVKGGGKPKINKGFKFLVCFFWEILFLAFVLGILSGIKKKILN